MQAGQNIVMSLGKGRANQSRVQGQLAATIRKVRRQLVQPAEENHAQFRRCDDKPK